MKRNLEFLAQNSTLKKIIGAIPVPQYKKDARESVPLIESPVRELNHGGQNYVGA